MSHFQRNINMFEIVCSSQTYIGNVKLCGSSRPHPGSFPDLSQTPPGGLPKDNLFLLRPRHKIEILGQIGPGPSRTPRNRSQTPQDRPGAPPRHPPIIVRRMCLVFSIASCGSKPTLQSSERYSSLPIDTLNSYLGSRLVSFI